MGDQYTKDVYLYHFSHAPPVFRLYRLYRPEGPELDYAAGRRGAGAYHSGGDRTMKSMLRVYDETLANTEQA